MVLSVERMLAARYITELHVTLWYKINCTVTVRDTDNCQNVGSRYRLYGLSLNLCYCKMEQDSIVDTLNEEM